MRGVGVGAQISPDYVLQDRTLSTGLRSYDGNLWEIYRVLDLFIEG